MTLLTRVRPGVPADPLYFWQKIHPRPRAGFFLGTGAVSDAAGWSAMSAGEPAAIHRVPATGHRRPVLPPIDSPNRNNANPDVPRWVGAIGFPAGRWFDPGIGRLRRAVDPLRMPIAEFGDFRTVVAVDWRKRTTLLAAPGAAALARLEKLWDLHRNARAKTVVVSRPASSSKTAGSFSHLNADEFSAMVAHAKAAIARGDVYQANLSLRFHKRFSGSPVDLFRVLCERNPSPYACLMKLRDGWVVSASPELLLRTDGRVARTRPIAGTRPRGETRRTDRRRQGQLLLSPKERAEHIMLVDLERNDLGRVCAAGGVRVTERFTVERYSHVMHIVSEVTGRLRPRVSAAEALRAVFPGGTITGCPKIRSIELIESLERESRGLFYGSAGYFSHGGDAVFNILIRTAVLRSGTVHIRAGSGIVADSRPRSEYAEARAKAMALLEAVVTVERGRT